MKYGPVKNTLPPAGFSMTKEELESKVLILEMLVEELFHHRDAQRELIKKLIVRTNPADE